MPDTVPAMLEPGEFVIRKDAVEEIGVDKLNMLNNIDRSSQMYMNDGGFVPQLQHGHSAIDELLAMNTLNNQANVDITRQSSMMNQHHRRLLPDAQFTPEKDILHFLQSSMSETNPMDEPRRGNSEDKNTIRKLSDEELKKLIPPKEKKYLVPRKNRKWDWRNFNQGGQAKSPPPAVGILGEVPSSEIKKLLMSDEFNLSPQDPDPLQIDARMRREFNDIGTIGMVDSSASLAQMLDKIQQDNAMRKHLEKRYGDKPETLRAHLEVRKDDFMPQEEIMRWLNYAAKQTQPKPDTIRGYDTGGYVEEDFAKGSENYEYDYSRPAQTVTGGDTGTGTTVDPMLTDLLGEAGIVIDPAQMDKFRQFDPSKDYKEAQQSYTGTMDTLQTTGADTLAKLLKQTQGMGLGEVSGIRESAQQSASKSLYQDYATKAGRAADVYESDKEAAEDAWKTSQLGIAGDIMQAGGGMTEDASEASANFDSYLQNIMSTGNDHWEKSHLEAYRDMPSGPEFLRWFQQYAGEGAKIGGDNVRSMWSTDKGELEKAYDYFTTNINT